MSWQGDIVAALSEKHDTEEAKQRADQAARSAEAKRLAQLEPQLVALEQVRAALVRSNWPGAHRSRQGMFRAQRVATMLVTEIVEDSGDHETGLVKVTAHITYHKYPMSEDMLIFANAGIYDSWNERRVGHVWFSGSRWAELTPELIKRAAARYCVTHNVELSLEQWLD
jgi:hypothetical protein